VTRRLRFRFSLLTMLIAVAWSAVVVWVNLMPRIVHERVLDLRGNGFLDQYLIRWGWPFPYSDSIAFYLYPVSELQPDTIDRPWSLAGDIAVGLLLVVVLTWASNQLLRRVGARLRRRKAAKEQP
jgi:hypothetical protein